MPHPRAPLSAAAAQHRLLLLSATRWFPVGLAFGLTTLLPLQRGLTLAELGFILSAQGFVVLGLELPTGGLADALGRRPLLVVAALVAVASGVLFLAAHGFWVFLLAMTLQGVFRALDSGPLESWYVDTAQAAEPDVAVERGLSRAGTVVGLAIAVGALLSGGLVAWHPLAPASALLLPYAVATGLYGLHAVLCAVLVVEPHRLPSRRGPAPVLAPVRSAPAVVLDSLRTLASSPVLRSLVLVEVFWSVALIGLETLNPIRLAELMGSQERAGAVYGPVTAAAWALFAVGSWLAGMSSRRIGVARTAVLARVLNGGFVVLMGLAAGPVGLLSAYLLAYLLHGTAGPVHNTLLHRQARSDNRTTVLSVNSMVKRRLLQPGAARAPAVGAAHLHRSGDHGGRRRQRRWSAALPPGRASGTPRHDGRRLHPAGPSVVACA